MTINDSRRISMELLTSNGCSNEDNNNNMLEYNNRSVGGIRTGKPRSR